MDVILDFGDEKVLTTMPQAPAVGDRVMFHDVDRGLAMQGEVVQRTWADVDGEVHVTVQVRKS